MTNTRNDEARIVANNAKKRVESAAAKLPLHSVTLKYPDALAGKFRRTFSGVDFEAHWNAITGFDIVAFEANALRCPDDGKSPADVVRERWGDKAVELIEALIDYPANPRNSMRPPAVVLRVGKSLDRMSQERCPVHGCACGQVGVDRDDDGVPCGTILGCTRGDCNAKFSVGRDGGILWATK